METAFAKALKEAQPSDRDQAAVALARRYVQLIDGVRGTDSELAVIGDLGPKLATVLTALGMTVAGRGAKGGAPNGTVAKSPLAKQRDELAARREQRQG